MKKFLLLNIDENAVNSYDKIMEYSRLLPGVEVTQVKDVSTLVNCKKYTSKCIDLDAQRYCIDNLKVSMAREFGEFMLDNSMIEFNTTEDGSEATLKAQCTMIVPLQDS